ncbi:MAG TPA: hypothetical protein VN639_04255 [Azonexus sp.]|nr:hypothetical protein [Azonexus sp.]
MPEQDVAKIVAIKGAEENSWKIYTPPCGTMSYSERQSLVSISFCAMALGLAGYRDHLGLDNAD